MGNGKPVIRRACNMESIFNFDDENCEILTTSEFTVTTLSMKWSRPPDAASVQIITTFEAHLKSKGFSDVSKETYAAVPHLRVKKKEEFDSNILATDTRVAPMKMVSPSRIKSLGASTSTTVVVHFNAAVQGIT